MPHEEAFTREHFKQVEESIRVEQEADQIAKDRPTQRPWWKFWAKRSKLAFEDRLIGPEC